MMTLDSATRMGLALALAIGLEDFVTVRENVARHLAMGTDPETARRRGTLELRGPMSLSAGLALFLLGGTALAIGPSGGWLLSFMAPAATALMVSWAVSWATPAILSPRRRPRDRFASLLDRVADRYHDLIADILSHRPAVVAVGIAIPGFTAIAAATLTVRAHALNDAPQPFRIEATGPDSKTLFGVALRIEDEIGAIPGAIAVALPPEPESPAQSGDHRVVRVEVSPGARNPEEVRTAALTRLRAIPLPPGYHVALAGQGNGTPLSSGGVVGLGLLSALVFAIRQGVIFVICARRRRQRGTAARVALIDAAELRVRPVLITTTLLLGAWVALIVVGRREVALYATAALVGSGGSAIAVLFLIPVSLARWFERRDPLRHRVVAASGAAARRSYRPDSTPAPRT